MTRILYPRTRQEDQREINRSQKEFTSGMYTDIVPNKVPFGGVSKLDNAIAYGDVISGRKGTRLFSSVTLPYEMTGVSFDRVGSIATITSAHTFSDLQLKYKLSDNNGKIYFIEQVNSSTELVVTGNFDIDTPESVTGLNVRGVINASYVNPSNGRQYYMIGRKIYMRVKLDEVWYEYEVIGDTLENVQSDFHEINNRIVLVNESGVYKLSDDVDDRYALQLNQDLPLYKINRSDIINMTNPSAYNYLYGFSSIPTNVYGNRRDENSLVELETPPHLQEGKIINSAPPAEPVYYHDGQYKDYTTNFSSTPIDDGWYIRITINSTYKDPTAYVDLTEGLQQPNFEITVNGTSYVCYPNFRNVTTMTEVATAIDSALKQIDTGLVCKYGTISDSGDSETLVLYIYHVLFYYVLTVGSATGIGFDMFLGANNCLATNNVSKTMGHSVAWLRYPETNSYITHYSLYRSKDILPHVEEFPNPLDPRLNNNPDTFALIDDIPACKVFEAYTTSGNMIAVSGFSDTDIGNDVTTAAGVTFTVTSKVQGVDNTYTTDYVGVDISQTDMYLAADDYTIISKTGKTIDTSTGYTFSASDIGKVIFYSDGTTSYIVDYDTTLGKAITADENPKISVSACLNPLARLYYDVTSDVTQNQLLEVNPLNMRFYDKLPYTSISAYNSGILTTASDRESDIYWCNTADVFRIGYHMSLDQKNTAILKNITAMLTSGDNVCIFTDIDTFVINIKQGQTIVTDFGESYFVLPEPIKLSGTIGLRNRQSWSFADRDSVILFTSEPAIRLFNGVSFGENLADGSIQKTYIKRLGNSVVVDYDSAYGMTIWGELRQ